MKKYFVLLILVGFLLFYSDKVELSAVSNGYKSGEYCFYVKGEAIEDEYVRCVKNGSEYIVYCPLYMADGVRADIKGEIRGESFNLTGDMSTAREIIKKLGAKVVSEGTVGDNYCIYLYSGKLKSKSIKAFGEDVNFQISINNEKITVGYPLILGSY